MGSSPSLPQAQCPVQPVHQAQSPIRCQRCDCKVKWKCDECVLLMCDKCGREDHDVKGHNIIDITIQVKISDVKTYQTKMHYIEFLAVAHNNSLWIGDGNKDEGGFNPFTPHTALQNVKLVEDKVKVILSFNMDVWDIAVTPTNDILLATPGESRLKQIKAGSNKVTDSVYYPELKGPCILHVTKDGRVIAGVNYVVVMDTDGKHLTRYKRDKNNKKIFRHKITSITSTNNGNIFVASYDRKVVVFGKTEIINIYRGHPTVNSKGRTFSTNSVVTTPMDNVIVADSFNNTCTLHILNNTGHLLTTYNTKDIGISSSCHLAITTEGSLNVLYMTSLLPILNVSLYKMVITGC